MGTSTQSWVWHCLTKIQTKSWISALPGCAEVVASRDDFIQQLCSHKPAEQHYTSRAGAQQWARRASQQSHRHLAQAAFLSKASLARPHLTQGRRPPLKCLTLESHNFQKWFPYVGDGDCCPLYLHGSCGALITCWDWPNSKEKNSQEGEF